MPDPTESDFRAAGLTSDAIHYPLSERACRWLARFNGVSREAMPRAWGYTANAFMLREIEERAEGESA